jgi:hypothetical protein
MQTRLLVLSTDPRIDTLALNGVPANSNLKGCQMRFAFLACVIGILAGCSSPTEPALNLTGFYGGLHQPTGMNVVYHSVVTLAQNQGDSTVQGVINFTDLPTGPRRVEFQGLVRTAADTTLEMTLAYQDSCAGSVEGALTLHVNRTPVYRELTGTMAGQDQCRGPYTSEWKITELRHPD